MSSKPEIGNNADDLSAPVPSALRGVWALKKRAQFSGWLQYVPPVALSVGAGLVAALASLFGWTMISLALWIIAGLFLARFLFEVIVIKFGWVSLPERAHLPPEGDLFAVMKARRSCRSFQRTPLTDQHRALVQTLVETHTALDAAHALTQGEIRAEYVATPLTVWSAVNATEFLVVIGPRAYDRLAVVEAGRAMQHVVMDLTARGISTCWIGPGADQTSVEAALGERFDASTDHVLCVIGLGYASRYWPMMTRMAGWAMHRRKPLADLVFDEAPGLPAPMSRAPFKRYAPAFEACRWSPSSYNSQTTRILLATKDKEITHVTFCSEAGSRYYAPLALGIWAANWELSVEALGIDGQLTPCKYPGPIAGGLVKDVVWRPKRETAQ